MAADPNEIIRRLNALKSLRSPHEQVWRDCFDHSFPIRGNGLNQQTLDAQQALDVKARLTDSTATDAGRILASALQSGMTPANARWFELEVLGADDDSKRWLEAAAETLHQQIHNANFDAVGMECQLDMVVAGWFAQYIDADENGLHFESWPIGQVYATSSKNGGKVDTVYRNYQTTALQAVTDFGEGNVSELTRTKASTEPDFLVEFVRAIYPRSTYAVGAKMAKNMPFASCTVEVQSRKVARESGYMNMPVVVPRWSLIPDTAYAVGPMFDALPDVRQLNELKRMDIASADIQIGGMWIATDDGVLNPRTVKVGARKIIVANDVDSMKPLMSGSNWQLATERIQQLQGAIRKLLMADQLQPQDGPAMTATEVHARVALLRQQLGPLFGRMQAEYLQGVIERSFMLALQAGVLGAPPPQLVNSNFTIKYISPLARAQKLEDVTAIQQLNAAVQPIVEMGHGEVLDNIDFDAQANTISEALGVPMKTMRKAEDVQAMRDARAKQQADQQQAAQQAQMQTMAAQAALDTQSKRAVAA
jgi:hypothetical protein